MPSLGIQGAAWATVADTGVAAILNMYFLKRYVGFFMDIKSIVKPMVAASAMGGVIYITYDLMMLEFANNALATMLGIGLGGIVYGAVLLMVGGIVEGDMKQIPFIGARMIPILRKLGIFKSVS